MHYKSRGKNEIDLLGEHMNQLSDTLEKTISELKTANNELQRDIEKKEEIDEMRKEFLANVSHELKTPIALIQGYAEGLKEGIHDALFPMMYFQGNNFYPFALDWKENDGKRWIIPGLGIYFLSPREQDWPLDEIVRQIHFTRQIKLNGQAYFRNRFLLDNTKGVLDELEENFYTYPALIPPMTWSDSIPPSVPSHPSVQQIANGKLRMSWQASADNSNQSVVYHLYGSDTYPVDIKQPQNLIATHLIANEYEYTAKLPWLQKRYFAVTAADRFGNESAPLTLNTVSDMDIPLLNKGNMLYLPEIKDAQTIIIYNMTNEEIWKTGYVHKLSLVSLPNGFYTVKIFNRQGKSLFAGSIMK